MFPNQLTPDTSTGGGDSREIAWRNHKDKGKQLFRNGSYVAALQSFQAALNTLSSITTPGGSDGRNSVRLPSSEREILLDLGIQCRLKIGGRSMASAAVEDSKQCILLNDRRGEAYVRLASSYIALGGHSNDACNALQNAVRLNPNNSAAKRMLLQQLRRDGDYTNNSAIPSAPPAEVNSPHSSSTTQQQQQQQQQEPEPFYTDVIDDDDHRNYGTDSRDDGNYISNTVDRWLSSLKEQCNRMIPSLRHRYNNLSEEVNRVIPSLQHRYNNLSEEGMSVLKVIVVLLVLYIALGGRFGLDTIIGSRSNQSERGDYESGNVYDRYHKKDYAYDQKRQMHTNTASQHQSHQTRYNSYDDDYSAHRRPSRRSTSHDSYYGSMIPFGFDGSASSIALMVFLVFILNRMRAVGRGAGFGMEGMGAGMGRWNQGGRGFGNMMYPMAMAGMRVAMRGGRYGQRRR